LPAVETFIKNVKSDEAVSA